MPYAEGRRSAPLSDREKVLVLINSTSLSDLSEVLPSDRGLGRGSEYPALLQYAIVVAARIWGSQRAALANLAEPSLWVDVCTAYEGRFAGTDYLWLPSVPPSARQQDAFVQHFAAVEPRLLEHLSARLTMSAVGLARHLGNFPDDVTPDWANPSPKHVLIGDGTFTEPFSGVEKFVDEATGEVGYLRSRAKHPGRTRFQSEQTNAQIDGKVRSGINHVNLLTSTRSGWVVLGCVQTLGGEIHGMREVVEPVLKLLGNRVHTLVWDRAVQGFDIEHLMARHRVLVINKQVAARKEAARLVSEQEALERFRSGQPLPLGATVYRTTAGLDFVRSAFVALQTIPCSQGPDHGLWVDDGAVVEAEHQTPHMLKVETATAAHANAHIAASGNYELETEWELPCRSSGELHQFKTVWTPRADKRGHRSDRHKALSAARVLPRGDERFRPTHGLRNQTESYNSWAKRCLGTGASPGRAMRLSARLQLLDFLATGTLANALTAHRDEHRLHLSAEER